MSAWFRCPTCGYTGWQDKHTCPPRWECKIHDWYGEDIVLGYALDDKSAAEKIVENNDDERTVLDHPVVVSVRKKGESDWKKFKVSASAVVEYTASEVED